MREGECDEMKVEQRWSSSHEQKIVLTFVKGEKESGDEKRKKNKEMSPQLSNHQKNVI